jgi:hypothetical protein
MRKDTGWRAVFCMLALWLTLGCAPPLTPVHTEVEAPSVARVQLTGIDDNIFKFVVYNLSDQPMVILRDEVVLVTPSGPQHRLPGGIDSVYNVAPQEHQPVNTRFDLSTIKTGDTLKVDFGPALQIGGKPTTIDSILIRVD